MSCYFLHIQDIFAEAGIQVTKDNKKDLDRILHELVDVPYKSCSPTWKRIKTLKADDKLRRKLVENLRTRWSE